MNRRKIYFDGGYRSGEMEIAVVAGGEKFILRGLGEGDRLKAEWLALDYALSVVEFLNLGDVVLLGDALDLVRQAEGMAGLPRIRHVRRTQNLAGIALAAAHPR